MPSLASPYLTLGGNIFNQGAKNITDIANKYKDNETITGFAIGSYLDSASTMMNAGTALQYNTAMSSHNALLTQQLENVKTGNQMQLMSAEGRIAKDLIGAQGNQQRLNIAATGKEQRAGIREQGGQDRLNIAATGVEQRAGMRVQGQEDRKNIRTAGAEERLNIGKRYQEERNMRADARGAIRSLGARFFG